MRLGSREGRNDYEAEHPLQGCFNQNVGNGEHRPRWRKLGDGKRKVHWQRKRYDHRTSGNVSAAWMSQTSAFENVNDRYKDILRVNRLKTQRTI